MSNREDENDEGGNDEMKEWIDRMVREKMREEREKMMKEKDEKIAKLMEEVAKLQVQQPKPQGDEAQDKAQVEEPVNETEERPGGDVVLENEDLENEDDWETAVEKWLDAKASNSLTPEHRTSVQTMRFESSCKGSTTEAPRFPKI